MERFVKKNEWNTAECLIMRALSAAFISGLFVLVENPKRFVSIESLNEFSNRRFLIIYLMVFLGITVLVMAVGSIGAKNMDAVFLMISSMTYGMCIALNTKDIYYISITSLMVVLVFRYISTRLGYTCRNFCLSDKKMKIILVIFVIVSFVYLCSLVVLRVYLMKPVTFDFGIFVQMFYYMKKSLIPYTTCERYELLSHFTVHFSPIFYLILPFYALFPSPYTLVVVQLAAVLSGVIPLYLMCRNKKLSNIATLALCLAYILYPALRGGLFFDFHENKFLAPLVLWLLYFFDLEQFRKKKITGIVVFTFLILMVKEDAPIYTACIGLFQIFSKKDKKDRIAGLLVMIFSVLYFFVVFYFMGIYGNAGGSITSFGRYENLMVTDYDGVAGLVMNILKDPAYVFSQLLSAEKLEFVLWMFLPVLFIPFRTRNISTYILLIPFVVLNLLSNYEYQHSIYYQYTYASGVLVIYLTLLELRRGRGIRGRTEAVCVMAASLLMSASAISDRNVYYNDYAQYSSSIDEVRDLLAQIPQEASVSSATSYLPVVAQRDEVYRHKEEDQMDYIVLTLSGYEEASNLAEAERYMENGYHLFGKIEHRVIVLEKNQ